MITDNEKIRKSTFKEQSKACVELFFEFAEDAKINPHKHMDAKEWTTLVYTCFEENIKISKISEAVQKHRSSHMFLYGGEKEMVSDGFSYCYANDKIVKEGIRVGVEINGDFMMDAGIFYNA